MNVRERVESEFEAIYGGAPEMLVRAPGRVNLIGEHTDYNDGFVLPVAINRELWVALRRRRDGRVRLHALEFGGADFPTNDLSSSGPGWSEYVKGSAWALREAGGPIVGWEGVLDSDIPIGAGLSSSAALEMAVLRAFAALAELPWQPTEAARMGQRVENEWIGVSSGIMDQLVIAGAKRGCALLIDSRSLEMQPVPLPAAAALVVLDTGTRRGLVGSAYNERRRQCEEASARLGVKALRDADRAMLDAAERQLERNVFRRARHVITENERVLEAARALKSGDLERLGRHMNESHESLRDDFEVSTEALDAMVRIARGQAGCFGARMTGAGFGGCAIALVARDHATGFAEAVARLYRDALGLEPRVNVCDSAGGASVMDADSRPGSSEVDPEA